MYVQCVISDDVEDDPDYTPWYLGHEDMKKLSSDAIEKLFTKFKKQLKSDEQDDASDLCAFFGWLERTHRSYTVFNSGPEAKVVLEIFTDE